jgi:hypothetical protein
VVITRQGQVVWDSAACHAPSGAESGSVQLMQGVPEIATIAWDRGAGTPTCAGSIPPAATGTFDAVALADGRSSPVRTFTLSS